MMSASLLLLASLANLSPAACVLSNEDREFMQQALDAWERGAREHLRIDPEPLPWWIAFDPACTWHLAADPKRVEGERVDMEIKFGGDAVQVHAMEHGGEVNLPNGGKVPARGLAFTSLYDEGTRPFFVMALPSAWHLDPEANADPRLEEIILGVVSHEIVHTRQITAVAAHIGALQGAYSVPEDISDDIVEERFSGVREFADALDREIDLFYAAAQTADEDRRLLLVRRGLEAARVRRNEYFCGDDAVLAPLEDIFLNMEGVATWTSHRLGHSTETDGDLVRARNAWVQDEGFVLTLLVSELVPGWRERMLGDELAAPFALLAEALKTEWNARPACGRDDAKEDEKS